MRPPPSPHQVAVATPPVMADVCRLCLSRRDTRPIFGGDGRTAPRIRACVRIQIDEDDGLPARVCARCVSNVDRWHDFKRLADRSQTTLREWREGRVGVDVDGPASPDDYPALEPRGPPILASLGLAPRTGKPGPTRILESLLTARSDDEDEDDRTPYAPPPPAYAEDSSDTEPPAPGYPADSKSDINRIIGVEDDDVDAECAPPPVRPGDDCSEDDEPPAPLVPIVEINEVPKEEPLSDAGESDGAEDVRSPTAAQRAFVEKYADAVRQVNALRCDCCDRDFPRPRAVVRHLRGNGYDVPELACYSCALTFPDAESLLEHAREDRCDDAWKWIHSGAGSDARYPYRDVLNARSYVCRLCPEKYQLRQFIVRHVLDAHESAAERVPPLTCFNCGRGFADERPLKKHLRSGECTVLVECDVCGERFPDLAEFGEHAAEAHARDAPEVTGGGLSRFAEPTGPAECPACDEDLTTYRRLVRHLKTVHDERKPHICRCCDAKFEHYTDLDHHVYLEHSDATYGGRDNPTGPADEEVEYNYSCTDCSAVFETVDGWSAHQIRVHRHVAHECDLCDKKFWDENELEEHRATHVRPQLFECAHCSNSFSSTRKLSEHMTQYHRLSSAMDRSGDSQFYCEICIRSFKSRQAFSNHMRIHAKVPTTNRRSGEPKRQGHEVRSASRPSRAPPKPVRPSVGGAPYSCDICGKGFIHKKNIWKHKKMLHPDVVNKAAEPDADVSKNVSTEEDEAANEERDFVTPQFDSFIPAIYEPRENGGSEGSLLYRCDLCDKRFAVKSSIWKHKRKKHGVVNQTEDREVARSETGRICCTICKINFPDKRAYYRHRKVAHKGGQLHACTVCGITLGGAAELHQHLRTAHAFQSDHRKASSDGTDNSSDDREGYEDDDDGDEENSTPSDFHPENHRDMKYSCESCGKSYSDPMSLQNHVCARRHPVSETYDCEICNKSYTSISALKSHRGWHLRSPDGRAAFSNSGLWMPQNKVTNKVSKHEVVDSPQPKGAALQIKRKLPPDVQVTLLKKPKTEDNVREAGTPTTSAQEKRTAIRERRYCELCKKVFSKRATCLRHIEEAHKSSSVFCPICNKSFTRKSNLIVHMRKHDTPEASDPADQDETDEERAPVVRTPTYRCEICNMQYNSSKALRRHRLKYHGVGRPSYSDITGKRPPAEDPDAEEQRQRGDYKCGLCEEEWVTQQELLNHPHYNCTLCGLHFSKHQKLAAHTKAHHSDLKDQRDHTLFPCTKCDRFYMNKKSLQRHMDTSHGH